jgi:DNA-binding LacI/PurR family transcriptional regulator
MKRRAKALTKPPTIRTVAEYAGVSVGTVSKVINNLSDQVLPETEQKVLRAIAALKYRPHAGGRFLKSRASGLIGLLVVEESDSFLLDPFMSQIAAGLCNCLGGANRKLVLFGARPSNAAEALLFNDVSLDALVTLCPSDPQARLGIRQKIKELGIPAVFLQDKPSDGDEDYCVVDLDQAQAARIIWSHIRRRKPKRIVFLEPELRWPGIEERHSRVRILASKEVDASAMVRLSCGGSSFQDAYDALSAADTLLEDGTAFVASNDRLALGAVRIASERGFSIPTQICAIGFHDLEFRSAVKPLLTSVKSDPYRLGEIAGRALLEHATMGRFPKKLIKLQVEAASGETI